MSHVEHNHACHECKTVSHEGHLEHGRWICAQCSVKAMTRGTEHQESGHAREHHHNEHPDGHEAHHKKHHH